MAAESLTHLELEIGHVLFMDVVGYSKLLTNEQREIQRQLSQIVRSTKHFQAAEAAGKLIRLPVGMEWLLSSSTVRKRRCNARWKSLKRLKLIRNCNCGWEFTAARL